MLNKTIKEDAIDDTILGFGKEGGDILLIEDIRLEPRYRGYGISLLAVDSLVNEVARKSCGWYTEGIVVVDASGLGSDLEPGPCLRELQKSLMKHWQLLVPRRMLKPGKVCNFVGQWNTLWFPKPDIATVVPHLFAPRTSRDTASVRQTALKRDRNLEEAREVMDEILASAPKRARVHQTS
jgi:hypothetical protein